MVDKPGNRKRLSNKNAIEQALQELSELPIPGDVVIEARDDMITRIAQIQTDIHTQLQVAAEINPEYRPLIGRRAKETTLLIKKHEDTLSEEEREEFSRRFREIVKLSAFDPIEFMGSVFLAASGEHGQKQKSSSA